MANEQLYVAVSLWHWLLCFSFPACVPFAQCYPIRHIYPMNFLMVFSGEQKEVIMAIILLVSINMVHLIIREFQWVEVLLLQVDFLIGYLPVDEAGMLYPCPQVAVLVYMLSLRFHPCILVPLSPRERFLLS